jgi:hypothetical protein
MTVDEARIVFANKYPNLEIISCYEYDSIYVFNAKPKKLTLQKNQTMLDHAFAVDKNSPIVRAFQPFDIPIDEYRRGKQIL